MKVFSFSVGESAVSIGTFSGDFIGMAAFWPNAHLLDGLDFSVQFEDPLTMDEDDFFDDEDGIEAVDGEKPRDHFYCAGYLRKNAQGQHYCTYRAPEEWSGRCPPDKGGCGGFYDCLKIRRGVGGKKRKALNDLSQIKDMVYVPTGIADFDKLLGGGLVLGNTALLAGLRGGGKTRLTLEIAHHFAKANRRAFFVSGEDTQERVLQMAKQLEIENSNMDVQGDPDGVTIDLLLEEIGREYKLLVIDSLQTTAVSTCDAEFKTTTQINAVVDYLGSVAKKRSIAVILIGQLTGVGEIAGGGGAQHNVDVLMRFDPINEDGDRVDGNESTIRKLWIEGKSRQGATTGAAYFEMDKDGRLGPLPERLLRKVLKSKLELVP